MSKMPKPTVEYDDIVESEIMEEEEERLPEVEAINNLNLDGEQEFELLAGYMDSEGVLHKRFTVREMTGRDEEAIGKPEVKANSSKLTSVLIQRCMTSLGTMTPKSVGTMRWQEIVRGMLNADQDYVLMKIREVSLGKEIEVNHVCPNPKCGAKLKTVMMTDEFDVEPFKGTFIIPFELPSGYRDKKGKVHRDGTMRLPTGLDREILTPAARNNIAKAQTTMLTRLIRFNDEHTHVDESVLMDMTTRDREYLQSLLNDHAFGLNLNFDVVCDVCGTSFLGNLASSNFI